jgi:hypothetical protein
MELYLHPPIHLHGVVLLEEKHRDKFTLFLQHSMLDFIMMNCENEMMRWEHS